MIVIYGLTVIKLRIAIDGIVEPKSQLEWDSDKAVDTHRHFDENDFIFNQIAMSERIRRSSFCETTRAMSKRKGQMDEIESIGSGNS